MERRCLKKEIEKLLSDYVGIRLRENEFDPRGQRQSTFLDDMAHYNLALSVALLWLKDSDAQSLLTKEDMNLAACSRYMYPNRTEREAMILSSYAGILMNSIPVEDIFEIYSMGPSATRWQRSAKHLSLVGYFFDSHEIARLNLLKRKTSHSYQDLQFPFQQNHWIHPFNLSLHPFAMLAAPQAAEHTRKHSFKYQRVSANKTTNPASTRRANKDRKQLVSLTRRKEQDDKGTTEAAKQGISPEKSGTNLKGDNAKQAKA